MIGHSKTERNYGYITLHVVLSDYETFAITFCLSAFDKLVEQQTNLMQYSTSLLWNCFFYNIHQ